MNCSIVKFEGFNRKRRFFHSLTFSRYKQFGIKLSPLFGFAKSSKYKLIFPLSQIPKLLVACVTGGLFLSKLRLNRKFFTLLLASSNFHVCDFRFVIFNVLFSIIYFSVYKFCAKKSSFCFLDSNFHASAFQVSTCQIPFSRFLFQVSTFQVSAGKFQFSRFC